MGKLLQWSSDIIDGLWHIIAPRCCEVCGRPLNANEEGVCRLCIDELPATGFEYQLDNPMFQRMEGRIGLLSAFSCFHFRRGETLRQIIHAFKYKGDRYTAREMGREMGRRAMNSGFIEPYDYIIPVPLHKKRLKKRGYNQAELIAEGMSEVTGVPVLTNVIERKVYASTQTRLSAAERYRNVSNDFCLAAGAEAVKGKTLLVLDDVFTTGATSEACLEPLSHIEGVRLGLATLAYAGN